MYNLDFPKKRYEKTLMFLKKHISTSEKILDLGVENPFSEILKSENYQIINTKGEDLDEDLTALKKDNYSVVTAFEILEHLLNPYALLKEIKADKLVVSVSLRLWFSSAYRSKIDPREQHFHEFEEWQLDWLLDKTGWEIIDRTKCTNPTKKIGIRSILRKFTPRHYIVYAQKQK